LNVDRIVIVQFIHVIASFNRRRRMKAESRQIPQKLAARLKYVYCHIIVVTHSKQNEFL